MVEQASRAQFLSFLEQEGLRVDSLVEGAVELAEEVHSGLMREDEESSFLETHTWPVAMDVVRHYRASGRNITGVEVASAILHDVMEDDERILNLYEAKSYGLALSLSCTGCCAPRMARCACWCRACIVFDSVNLCLKSRISRPTSNWRPRRSRRGWKSTRWPETRAISFSRSRR